MRCKPSRHLASLSILSIGLVLSVAAYDVSRAADGDAQKPDSSRTERVQPGSIPGTIEAPVPSVSARETPLVTSEDGLGEAPIEQADEPEAAAKDRKDRVPIYKNKWLWAAGASVLVATLVAIAAGGNEKPAKELPDFPPPPTR